MIKNHCIGCMCEAETYPCPHCGFDPAGFVPNELALAPNTILHGKYLVGRVLGHGGFGITYIGLDLALNIRVAIKEFFPQGHVMRNTATGNTLIWNTSQQAKEAQSAGMEGFLKEARKMARVSDVAQVVNVREIFQDGGTAYIVMDYVEGETLKDLLLRNGEPLEWEQAKKIFLPAVSAMDQVHKAGLIHRDLSPDNLMIQEDGQVRVLDLGAAKDLKINSGASSMVVAKGGFSPVEQYTERGGSGTWTDVYAMAATIYYALTGKLPPNSIDRLEEDTLDMEHPAILALPASVRNGLKLALEVLPQKRMQTMGDLRKALEGKKVNAFSASKKKYGKYAVAAVVLVVAAAAVFGLVNGVFIPGSAYKAAMALKNEGKYDEAIAAFAAMDGYRDSESQITLCLAAKLDEEYDAAVALMNAGDYDAAINAFRALNGYRDSKTQIADCQTAILENRYNDAMTRIESNDYEGAIGILTELNGYRDSEAQLAACDAALQELKYNAAVTQLNAGDILGAYESLVAMDGYRDSAELAASVFEDYKEAKIQAAEVGDYVLFGNYEQDNDPDNGKEPISWLVLAKENGKLLLISQYALDSKVFNPAAGNITYDTDWARSSLHGWLNSTFIVNAFTKKEGARIGFTAVQAGTNPEYTTNPGPDTMDRVFLLSIKEARQYFGSDEDRRCPVTPYAIAQGAGSDWLTLNTYDGQLCCHWWLRSPGANCFCLAYVKNFGEVECGGTGQQVEGLGVRPAMWLNLN